MADEGKQSYSIYLDNSQLRKGAQESVDIIHGIGQSAKEEGDAIDDAISKIGKAAAGVFAVAKVKDFVSQVANVRGEFQQLELAFTTMLGSAEQADKLMSQLIKTAATTPFGMSDVANSAKQLLAYGVEADKVNDTLIRLGDIAAGLSIPINDLAYLYGTTMVQGRMYAQDLNQFLGRGIPLADELAKQFNVSTAEVKELVSAGKVGFPEVEQAIISMTSEGSKFGGLMAAQSQTITGQISNIEDSIEQMFNELGKQSEGVINDTLAVVSDLVDNWETVGKALLVVISTYGAYKAAVLAVAAAHKVAAIWGEVQAFLSLTKCVTSAKDAMLLLNMATKANPIGLILSVVAAAASAFVLFNNRTDESTDKIKQLSDKAKEQEQTLKDLEKQEGAMVSVNTEVANSTAKTISKIDLLRKQVEDGTLSINARRKAIKELQSIVPSYNASIDAEGRLHVQNKNAIDDEIESLTRLAYAKAIQSKREQIVAKQLDAELKKASAQRQVTEDTKAVTNASNKVKTEQKKADKANARNREARGGDLMAGFQESSIADMASSQINNVPVEAARNAEKAAKLKLETSKNEVKIAQKEHDMAQRDLDDLDKYAKDHNIDLTKDYSKKTNTTSGGGKTTKGTGKTGKDDTQQLADAAAQRNAEIAKYDEQLKQQRSQAMLDIRQAEINAMKEGTDKELAQNELNYDRLIADNDKRRDEMISALKDKKVLEWQNQNPKATKEQEVNYRSSLNLSDNDLTAEQQATLQSYTDIANQIREKGNREALANMLSDVMTYEQKRAEIEQEYADKRNSLYAKDKDGNVVTDSNGTPQLREGATQGNLDEINRQAEEALQAVDEEFASREESYSAWCEEIANLSLEKLEGVLEKAQQELTALEGSNTKDENKLATARAKVAKATSAIKKANAKNDVSPKKRTVKEWEDLYDTLNTCCSEFEKIGETVDGTIGDIISTAGQMASSTLSMINGIVQLTQMSATGITGTAKAGATAISTMEKASVILTIISAAMQVAMAIVNLFNSDDSKQEEIEALQSRIDQLQWQLDNADVVRLQKSTGDAIERIKNTLAGVRQELVQEQLEVGNLRKAFYLMYRKASKNNELLSKSVDKIAEAYANMSYTADKALGESKYATLNDDLKNISEQQILIQEQIDTERSKKKTDYDQIEEWEEKIQELTEQAVSLINDAVEEIIGGSAEDIADELADAFIEAFQDGEDAAEAWGDKVNEIVADIIKNMLVQQFLEDRLGEVFDKYKAKWFQNGQWVGTQAVIDSMSGFANDLQVVGDEFAEIWENLPDSVKNMFTTTADAEREASSEGIATASQDSVDELNGRMTAVQSHTYSISENTKILVANTQAILNAVLSIDNNTQGLSERMETVEGYVKVMRDTVNDIALKGVKLK